MILRFTIWEAEKKSATSGRHTSRRFTEWCTWSIQLHPTEWMKSKRIWRCYWRMRKLLESQFYCKFSLKFCNYCYRKKSIGRSENCFVRHVNTVYINHNFEIITQWMMQCLKIMLLSNGSYSEFSWLVQYICLLRII